VDFTEARDSEWQWHQLGHMQVCTLLQTNNHASTPPLSFFTGRMPFLPPNQQRQSTEGTNNNYTGSKNDWNYWNESANIFAVKITRLKLRTHTHIRLMVPFQGPPGYDSTRKVKPIWILLKQETVSGSGISWPICKSAPHCRQITCQHPKIQSFTGWMPFLPPNQLHQSI